MQGGYGNPQAATLALHAAAQRLGVRLFEHVAVTALTAAFRSRHGRRNRAGAITAPIVILAAGAWSVPLAASVGVAIPLVPTRMTTGTIRHAAFARNP